MKVGNNALLAGLAIFTVSFLGVFAFSQSLPIAIPLAFGLAVAATLIVHGSFPSSPELDEFNAAARRRVKNVYQLVDSITRQGRKVKSQPAREALLEACTIIPKVLKAAQEKDADNLNAHAAKIGVYLKSVDAALGFYLEVQESPDLYAGGAKMLGQGQAGFIAVEPWAVKIAQAINSGQTSAFRTELEMIKPMEVPEIS